MALIELRGVTRRYTVSDEEVRALVGINLRIEAGEYVAIMGQSGSGKSTLMNLLGCLDSPSEGQFLIDGQDTSRLDPDALAALRRERFGFIFQRYHLLPQLDACANVALPAVYAGAGSQARLARAKVLLQRLGLGQRLHHKPNELSGGQQQRVSIARALMNGGQVILADEPTGALDSASGAEMLSLLKELHTAGHTIILVTHDHSVAGHAQRLIELRDGRVLRDDGTPAGHAPRPLDESEQPGLQRGGWLRRLQVQWREALATAWKSLQGNRLRTFLSMLGISIGIAAVVSIVALTSAASANFEGEYKKLMSGQIQVWLGNSNLAPGGEPRPFRLSELDAMRSLPGVSGVQAERQTMVDMRHRSRNDNVSLRAADLSTLATRGLKLDSGRDFNALERAEGAQVILLDEAARQALFRSDESALGKTVLVAMAGGDGTTLLPFLVIGTLVSEGQMRSSFGMGSAFVPERTYIDRLDSRPSVEAFSVKVDFTLPPDEVLRQVNYRLRALRGSEDFSSSSGDSEYRKMQEVRRSFSALFAGVGAIALLVGGVGVMNIMLVSVSERTREIGIRMAVGARPGDVRLQFLIEAVVLCCLGGLVGVVFSWLGAQGVNAMQNDLHVRISWAALVLAFAVSSAVGLVFGIVPARRAAALSPVDALARE